MATLRFTVALWGALSSACVAAPSRAGEPGSAAISFSIRAGTLDEGLKALAAQSRVQLLYSPDLVLRRRTTGLRAELKPEQALARLLQGTGLEAERVNANTFLVRAVAKIAAKPVPPAPPPPRFGNPVDLTTVHVTGTHIPRAGLDAITPSPLTVIERAAIEASGHQTLFELLRFQPGMVSHHPVDVAADGGDGGQQPFANAATASLYALGPRATLFLIDGRRVANYGLVSADLGGLTDLDAIPLSIVDRVEIIRGGASAIYGADAMAGVVNIILRKGEDGSEAVARYGVSARGDARQQQVSFTFWHATKRGGSLLLAGDYFKRDALNGTARRWRTMDHRRHDLGDWRFRLGYRDENYDMVRPACPPGSEEATRGCLFDPPRYATLQPAVERLSAYARMQESVGDASEWFADVRASDANQYLNAAPFHAHITLPDGHPDNIDGATGLDYAFFDIGQIRNRTHTRAWDIATGLRGVSGDWQWSTVRSHHLNAVDSRIDGLLRETVFNDAVDSRSYRFGAANPPELLAVLSPRVVARGEATLDQFSVGLNGPWFTLPAGQAKVAAGIEVSRDALRHRPDALMLERDVALSPQKVSVDDSRYGSAMYAELSMPVLPRLQADLAVRLDHRQGYGGNVSPKLGLKWSVLDEMTLRGTAATGYRAPTLFELRSPHVSDSTDFVVQTDALAPCRYAIPVSEDATYCFVGRGALENPDLRPESSRSYTVGFVWSPTSAFSLSLDHFRIVRTNEILSGNAIDDPAVFWRSIERDENGLLVGLNDYFENVGRTDVRGWEIDVRYRFDGGRFGRYMLRAGGHYLDKLERKPFPTSATLDYAGFGATDRSALAALEWVCSDWTTTLSLRALGRSRVGTPQRPCPPRNAGVGRCPTPGSGTLDLNVAYVGLPKWDIAMNVRDLGDRDPVNYRVDKGGYDIAQDDPRGRYYLLSAAYRF